MRSSRLVASWSAAGLVAAALIVACVDEKIVYRSGPNFKPLPQNSGNFVGYQSEADTLPVCGACHVDTHADWKLTRHARAWNTLVAINQQNNAVCQPCHSVSARGNAVTTTNVGYVGTGDARYHDVQCESCHGPGLAHIQNPEVTQPLASMKADTNITTGCGECHSGVHHPFVADWKASAHGSVPHWSATGPNTRAECRGCHVGQGALDAFNVRADYLEKSMGPGDTLAIVCAVCHDPHDRTNPKQLRYPVDVADVESNLCMKCHHKRGTPDPVASRGPHSPEGPLLLGTAGWWPPDVQAEIPDQIVSTHGTQRNPRLCAQCHVEHYEVEDKLTGDFLVTVTGHRFQAIPCVDANGIPTDQDDCADSERRFVACTASGCHGDENAARAAKFSAESDILNDVAELQRLLNLVRAARPGEFSATDGRWSTAEGADWNRQLAIMPGSIVHNPFLVRALIIASINQVKKDYGVTARTSETLADLLPRISRR